MEQSLALFFKKWKRLPPPRRLLMKRFWGWDGGQHSQILKPQRTQQWDGYGITTYKREKMLSVYATWVECVGLVLVCCIVHIGDHVYTYIEWWCDGPYAVRPCHPNSTPPLVIAHRSTLTNQRESVVQCTESHKSILDIESEPLRRTHKQLESPGQQRPLES